MQYVAYDVCASIREALYTGTAQPDAAFGHTPSYVRSDSVLRIALCVHPTITRQTAMTEIFKTIPLYFYTSPSDEIELRLNSP
jgi:hypothetical protein